jgi:hypothetical protein
MNVQVRLRRALHFAACFPVLRRISS